MRNIRIIEHISLDGVIQGGGGPKEDTSGGFAYGGWTGTDGTSRLSTNGGSWTSRCPQVSEVTLRSCGGFLNGFCCGLDYVDDAFRLREHRHMAAVEFVDGCAHALGHGALQIGMNRAVFFADDVPTGLLFPGGSSDFCLEQVWFRNTLRRQNELFLLLG